MMYNKLVLTLFFNPQHVGILDENGAVHVQAKNMDLFICIDGDDRITNARFKSSANPYKIAGLEWLCRALEGDLLSNHPKIDYKEIADILEIPILKYSEAIALEVIYKKLISTAKDRVFRTRS